MINAGELRQRVIIQDYTKSKQPNGAIEKTWSNKYNPWAKVEMLKGKELFAAMQIHAQCNSKITIRYRPDISNKMRVLYGTRIFNIIAPPIDVDERHQYITLLCQEVENSGDK